MSQASQADPPPSQSRSQPQHGDARKPNLLAKFDDRIDNLRDHVLPQQPYLVTIPSDFPYRRHHPDFNLWYLNAPFSKREEQLQYMSLLPHQDNDESLMKVDGTRIDENGRLLARDPTPRSEAPSRPETPVEAAPKKKISLKDYKSKDKSAINTPERKPADDIRRQALKSHKEEVNIKREEQATKPKNEDKTDAKVPATKPTMPAVGPESKTPIATSTQYDKETQRPAKKRRLSIEDDNQILSQAKAPKLKEQAIEKRPLPGLLSPDMPTSTKKQRTKDLPVLLLPNLPQALEKAATAPSQRSDEVRAILKTSIGSPARTSDKKAVEDVSKDTGPGRVRPEGQLSVKSLPPSVRVSSPIVRPLSAAGVSKVNVSSTNGGTASPRPRQRHIISLKYGKKNRRRVEMILKLSSKKKKEAPAIVDKDRPSLAQPVTRTDSPAPVPALKTDKKHNAEAEPEVPPKRAKISHSLEPPVKLERPTTPRLDSATRSKSTLLTPKKEPKPTAMQRIASSDTIEARTPSQDAGRTSTPLNVSHLPQPKTSPTPSANPSRSAEQASWNDLQTKIFALGRSLKKEGSERISGTDSDTKKQGVLLLVEGLLCFMLNSTAQAQARPNIDACWSTILPYYTMVSRCSRPYKHLNGLVAQLGAVCRQHLLQEQMRRLARETLPDEHIGSAPTPGSDGNTRSADDPMKKQKAFLDLRDELVSNSRDLRTSWLDGQKFLPPNVVENEYSATWRRRSEDFTKRNPDKLNPKELPKDFYLPLDPTTNVVEATNFALEFLKEWARYESVAWETKIQL